MSTNYILNDIELQIYNHNKNCQLKELGEQGIREAMTELDEVFINKEGQREQPNPALVFLQIQENKDWGKLDKYIEAIEKRKARINRFKYRELRRKEYPTYDEVTEAILEKEEGRPEKYYAIIKKRAEIKAKYPKPL